MITHAIAENGNVVDAANAIMGSMYQCIYCGQKVYKKASVNGVAYFARQDAAIHDANGCLATEYDRRTAINLNRITCNAFINRLCRPPQPRNPGPGGRDPGGPRPGPGRGTPTGVIRVTALRSLYDLHRIIAPIYRNIDADTVIDGVQISEIIYLTKFGIYSLPTEGPRVIQAQIDDIVAEKGYIEAHTYGYDDNHDFQKLRMLCKFTPDHKDVFIRIRNQLLLAMKNEDGSYSQQYAQNVWIAGNWAWNDKRTKIETTITNEHQMMILDR